MERIREEIFPSAFYRILLILLILPAQPILSILLRVYSPFSVLSVSSVVKKSFLRALKKGRLWVDVDRQTHFRGK